MIWLIFPVICTYFLIGWMLADAFKTDLGENSVESVLWFLFWPITLLAIAAVFVFFLALSFISVMILSIDKAYRYFRPRRKRHNAS